jgi:hypothetical protein
MDNENNIIMSRYAFERMQAKDEKNDLWRNIIIITLIILLVVTNAMWLVAWNQYDYVDTEDSYSIEAQQDGEGINIVGGGDIDYGANSNDNTQETNQIEDSQ